MFKILRFVTLSVLLTSLPACGIVPWWMSAAHTAGDIVLHQETGKTSTEHIASEATKKDCKWARALDRAKVCMTKTEYLDYLLALNCKIISFDFLGLPYCKASDR